MRKGVINKIICILVIEMFIFTQSASALASLNSKNLVTRIIRRGSIERESTETETPPIPTLPEATETGFVKIPDGGLGRYGEMIDNFITDFFNPENPGYSFKSKAGTFKQMINKFLSMISKGKTPSKRKGLPANLTIEGMGSYKIDYQGNTYTMEGDKGGITVSNWEDGAKMSMVKDGVKQTLEFDQSEKRLVFSSRGGDTVTSFKVVEKNGELYMSSQGRTLRVTGREINEESDIAGAIKMHGPNMDVKIVHGPLPERFDPEADPQTMQKESFAYQIKDFDGEIKIDGGSLVVDYDENAGEATVTLKDDGGNEVATTTAEGESYWSKGRVFLTISKAISLLAAGTVGYSFFNTGAVEAGLAQAGTAALMGHYLYRMYYRLSRAGLLGWSSAGVDYKGSENPIEKDSTVMEEGLQEPIIIGYSIAAFEKDDLDELKEGIEKTIKWVPDDKTNGNLNVAIVSDTFTASGSVYNQLKELKYWKELKKEFEGKAEINLFVRTPQGNIGYKPIACFDAGNYALTGGTQGGGVTEAERKLGKRKREVWTIDSNGEKKKKTYKGRPEGTQIFGGFEFIARLARGDKQAIQTAINKGLLTEEQVEDLGLRDQPLLTSREAQEYISGIMGKVPQTKHFITMDPGDTIGEEGHNPGQALLRWAAQVTTSIRKGLGFEGFTPRYTTANPEESKLTRFQDRAAQVFEPVIRAMNSIFKTQTSYGNTWFLMDSYKEKVMGMRVNGTVIDDPILDVDTMTSHDQIESMALKIRQLLNVRVPNSIAPDFKGLKDQFQRWIYGDAVVRAREYGYNHPVGRFINRLAGAKTRFGKFGPVTPEQEFRASNPVDFLMANVDFAKFLTLMSITSRIPQLNYPANPAIAGAVTAAMLGGLFIGGTLIAAPLVEAIKGNGKDNEGLKLVREALRNRNYADATKQLRQFIKDSVNPRKPGPGMAVTTAALSHAFLMPLLVVQPLMYYTAQVYRLREWNEGKATEWKKVPMDPFEWKKKIPMHRVADYVTGLLGAAFTYNLYDAMGISFMSGLGFTTIGLPLMLWVYTSRKLHEAPEED